MGVRTGNPKGRPKGSPNKATVAKAAEIEASGLTPLDYMLSILRDTAAEASARFEAAKASAPYVHPRLAAVELGNKPGEAFIVATGVPRPETD